MFNLRSLILTSVAAVIALNSTTARADIARLVLDSQPGDFVGGGKHSDVTYTPDNTIKNYFQAQIGATVAGQPAYLHFTFLLKDPVTGGVANPDEYAILDFSTQTLGIPIAPGTYTDAQRASFAAAGHPGLDVSFEHRGSNTLTGQFTVNSVSFFTDSDNVLQIGSFDVNFEQHSEGAAPALFGHFTFNAAAVPEPSSLVLVGVSASCMAAAAYRRRRNNRASQVSFEK